MSRKRWHTELRSGSHAREPLPLRWDEALPPELWIEVLLHLDYLDVMTMCTVSRRARALALRGEVWSRLTGGYLQGYRMDVKAYCADLARLGGMYDVDGVDWRAEELTQMEALKRWWMVRSAMFGESKSDAVFNPDGVDVTWYCVFRQLLVHSKCDVCGPGKPFGTVMWSVPLGARLCRRDHRYGSSNATWITKKCAVEVYGLRPKTIDVLHEKGVIFSRKVMDNVVPRMRTEYHHERVKAESVQCHLGALKWIGWRRVPGPYKHMIARCKYLYHFLVAERGLRKTHRSVLKALRYGAVTPQRRSWIDEEALDERDCDVVERHEALGGALFVLGMKPYAYIRERLARNIRLRTEDKQRRAVRN